MKNKGNSDDTLQIIVSSAKLEKQVSVTPKNLVSAAPISVPTVLAPLKMLIKVANSTASIPGGHNRAANTNEGKNAIWPNIENTTSSPNTNAPSGIPSSRL
mmetsp:Transcript_24862/g.37871  ORF Transcript_24862/g.37871 Transcript_24862/m.37871 type:complete len:101 (+) Transcript_24862:277-579(+)|eukprot:CAMPEP_0196206512 /NCGR_PEP_ID=MMETSP0912-20130531/7859_1 /TAXON_ID=49265 /ORGANISM="Thalassiosira rotula, Strain GSO102" /LENGTH=100 /DNA_ID=CAMNT_0041481065 /DNA_START=443 /DNA_END=748 /DNA_ORIENTATION=-